MAAGAIAGAVRAANKILSPSLVETDNYKTFWGKAILKSFKIAEGEINLSDPLTKIFFISAVASNLICELNFKFELLSNLSMVLPIILTSFRFSFYPHNETQNTFMIRLVSFELFGICLFGTAEYSKCFIELF
jgi:hypothetical protein